MIDGFNYIKMFKFLYISEYHEQDQKKFYFVSQTKN